MCSWKASDVRTGERASGFQPFRETLSLREASWEGLSVWCREAHSSPLIPAGSLSQSQALLRAQFLAQFKKESVRVGQISHFLPHLGPKEGACKARMCCWKYPLPHRHCESDCAWAADPGPGCLKKPEKCIFGQHMQKGYGHTSDFYLLQLA